MAATHVGPAEFRAARYLAAWGGEMAAALGFESDDDPSVCPCVMGVREYACCTQRAKWHSPVYSSRRSTRRRGSHPACRWTAAAGEEAERQARRPAHGESEWLECKRCCRCRCGESFSSPYARDLHVSVAVIAARARTARASVCRERSRVGGVWVLIDLRTSWVVRAGRCRIPTSGEAKDHSTKAETITARRALEDVAQRLPNGSELRVVTDSMSTVESCGGPSSHADSGCGVSPANLTLGR